jgi:hypothetical protein
MPPTAPAIQQLMFGLIDYAGLFPPAALDLESAARRYAEHARGPDGWILNRFVIPVRRLPQLASARGAIPPAEQGAACWPLTVILGPNAAADTDLVRDYSGGLAAERAPVVAVEASVETPGALELLAGRVPDGVRLIVELPLTELLPRLARAAREAGAMAKVRMGGIRAEDIPEAGAVVRFLEVCAEERLPWKATAGLHHPVRREAPLTYEAHPARATMHGFLNLLLAAAALWRGRSPALAHRLLGLEHPGSLQVSPDGLRWGDASFTTAELAASRAEFLQAIGSCSFHEPVEELAALGLSLVEAEA